MARTALITGATGLLGRQVILAFNRAGWNAVGTGFTRADPPAILKLNLSDPAEIASVLQDVKYALPCCPTSTPLSRASMKQGLTLRHEDQM